MVGKRWVILTVTASIAVLGCGSRRPTEKANPSPEMNPGAVVWRTPEPPRDPRAGDVWVDRRSGA